MSGKDKDLDLGSLDWDSALAEWEEKAFVPEPAKDRETESLGTLQGTPLPPPTASVPAPSKPLYVPPPSAAPKPPNRYTAPLPDFEGFEGDEESGATVVSVIPRELLRKVSEQAPKSSGGGLGQMFARTSTGSERLVLEPGDLGDAPTATHAADSAPPDDAVFTSAQPIPGGGSRATSDSPPRARGLKADPHAALPEGEMFDPFSEPDPFVSPSRTPRPAPEIGATPSAAAAAVDPDEGDESAVPDVAPGPPLLQPRERSFDPDQDTSSNMKGAIHAPARREYDPNEETSMMSRSALRAKLDEPADDEGVEPTRLGARDAVPQRQTIAWEDERPAAERLDEAKRAAFTDRAAWLESEARATDDRSARARALLVASEMRAILGETEAAEILAREAAATAPTLAMAPRQARALAPLPRDAAPLAEALDAEGRQAPTQAARLHGALLAADVLRLAGDEEGAAKRWDQAIRIAPNDPRAPLARAADRIGRGDLTHAALRSPDIPELAPLAEAVARALQIRGVRDPEARQEANLPNDALRRARAALDERDLGTAAHAIAELARVPELRDASMWLAASLASVAPGARAESVDWLRVLARTAAGRRALAARAVELDANDVVVEACAGDGAAGSRSLGAADRAVLAFLAEVPEASSDQDLDTLAAAEETHALASALAAVGTPEGRVDRGAGSARSRDTIRLARLVAADASNDAVELALAPFDGEHDGETRAIALEMSARAGRYGEVSDAIASWSDEDGEGASDRSLAAAVVAERSGDVARAVAAYTSARAFDPTNEAALRALAVLDPRCDLGAELRSLGDARGEGTSAAMAWLEAVARAGSDQSEELRNGLLEAAHSAAPDLPMPAFLAERSARRAGDVEAVLRWIRERRSATESTPDAVQGALDDVVEALLVADTNPTLATDRLLAAHKACPSDIALRELYERVAPGPLHDRASWREGRAAIAASPASKARLHLQAADDYERAGDAAATLRNAVAAHALSGTGLSSLALERAELAAGAAARLADALLTTARTTDDRRIRREAYERLADLDATGRDDAASALLWHRTILEEEPAYLPSLRHVEHALLSDGRIDELEPLAASIARALTAANDTSAEAGAHAQLSARLRMRGVTGEWEPTRAMVDLAAALPDPSLWALRSLAAHTRGEGDEEAFIRTSIALASRTQRSPEVAALFVRAAEAALRADDLERTRSFLDRAVAEDPADVVTWGLLAEVRQRGGDAAGAAEACESLARSSVVDEHRLLALYDAGRIWLDDVGDDDRGIAALEQASAIDLSFEDVFARLSALYAKRGARAEMAALLERRIATLTHGEERIQMEIARARALLDMREPRAARDALEAALEAFPDHVSALSAYADLCAAQKDWGAAEQAWVRLARLLPEAEDQRAVYEKLGELYAEHAPNYSRAEVALKEVLKTTPDDVPTLERLAEVYTKQNDGARALEVAQHLLKLAHLPHERRARLLTIAHIYETTLRDPRKSEQALESARREFPNDVAALRALAEFYQRQKQLPAVNILLDRASADARRALSAGRFSPALFEVLQVVHELRGKKDAARVVAATVAALEGERAQVPGAGGRAGEPRLNDLLAPEALSAGLRALLAHAGDALDMASALDLRALHAQPLAPSPAQSRLVVLASSLGLPSIQMLVSPHLGRTCVPSTSSPPTIVLGEPLVAALGEPAAAFVVTRALKLVQARASALVRTPPAELAVLMTAWLQGFNSSWKPQGIAPAALADAKRRLAPAMPRSIDSDIATIALEVAGTLGPHLATLGVSTIAWADRVALLAVGDPGAALDGVAWSLGMNDGAPRDLDRRAAWVLHTAEVRELLVFGTSDAYAEARTKVGIS
jgi:predicted Zn-dependent protease